MSEDENVDLGVGLVEAFAFLDAFGKGQYDSRDIIGRDEPSGAIVDTCWAPDAECFETAVKDSRYSDAWIVVEQYGGNRAGAGVGHARWCKALATEPPPTLLRNIPQFGFAEREFPLKAAAP